MVELLTALGVVNHQAPAVVTATPVYTKTGVENLGWQISFLKWNQQLSLYIHLLIVFY